MIITRDLDGLQAFGAQRATDDAGSDSVVSIGVFDGVHLGHQAILRENVARSLALGAVSTVVTFAGHPKQVLLGRAPRTLTSLDHRLEMFRRAGVQHAVALTFDAALRELDATTFVRTHLVEYLGAAAFVLGFDSKFGRDREGSPEFLRDMGFDVSVISKVDVEKRAISSTAIREAVELGDLDGAARMLGRPVSVLGEVVRGQELGRMLGFPTANLDPQHELHPPPGVYACRAHLLADNEEHQVEQTYLAVTNIGFRPSVGGERPTRPLLESHLLDMEGDLYGRTLEVEFVERLREERRFDGLEALKEQIAEDVKRARKVLASSG